MSASQTNKTKICCPVLSVAVIKAPLDQTLKASFYSWIFIVSLQQTHCHMICCRYAAFMEHDCRAGPFDNVTDVPQLFFKPDFNFSLCFSSNFAIIAWWYLIDLHCGCSFKSHALFLGPLAPTLPNSVPNLEFRADVGGNASLSALAFWMAVELYWFDLIELLNLESEVIQFYLLSSVFLR